MTILRSGPSYCLAALFSLLAFGQHSATAQLLGPELQVNSYTTGLQASPAVAADGGGNFVVVWESYGQDSSVAGVFGQRFDSSGSRLGLEFQVHSYTTNLQGSPAVATDGAGNFVVVWESSGQDGPDSGVFLQRFDALGAPVGGEFRVNSYTTSYQRSPAVAADGSGNFVVVWESSDQDGSYSGVFGQRYDVTGSPVGGEFRVNTYTTESQRFPAVSADGLGNFVVVWDSRYQDGSYYGVFGQRFDSAGSPLGSEFRANSFTTNDQFSPAVAADSAGNFIVAWTSVGQDGSNYGVFGQRFNSAGTAVGSEFRVNSYTTGDQGPPAVAADGAGGFVVVWDSRYQDGADFGVFGQQFNPAGAAAGSEFRVNSYTLGGQLFSQVAADGAGHFVVAWASSQDGSSLGVIGQRLAGALFADGFNLGDACAWSAAVGGGCP